MSSMPWERLFPRPMPSTRSGGGWIGGRREEKIERAPDPRPRSSRAERERRTRANASCERSIALEKAWGPRGVARARVLLRVCHLVLDREEGVIEQDRARVSPGWRGGWRGRNHVSRRAIARPARRRPVSAAPRLAPPAAATADLPVHPPRDMTARAPPPRAQLPFRTRAAPFPH